MGTSSSIQKNKEDIIEYIVGYFTSPPPFFIKRKDIHQCIDYLSNFKTNLFYFQKSEYTNFYSLDIIWKNGTEPGLFFLDKLGYSTIINTNIPKIYIVPIENTDYYVIITNEYEAIIPYYIHYFIRDELKSNNINVYEFNWIVDHIENMKKYNYNFQLNSYISSQIKKWYCILTKKQFPIINITNSNDIYQYIIHIYILPFCEFVPFENLLICCNFAVDFYYVYYSLYFQATSFLKLYRVLNYSYGEISVMIEQILNSFCYSQEDYFFYIQCLYQFIQEYYNPCIQIENIQGNYDKIINNSKQYYSLCGGYKKITGHPYGICYQNLQNHNPDHAILNKFKKYHENTYIVGYNNEYKMKDILPWEFIAFEYMLQKDKIK